MSEPIIEKAFADHAKAIQSLAGSAQLLQRMADMLIGALRAGGKVLIFGNGGSAADAQHIAGELLGRFRRERPAFAAIALSTDTSTITSVGNDYGYDQIFARQVEGLIRSQDVAWGLSTSGNSANVLKGLRTAREHGAKTLVFSGGHGGQVAELADLCLIVPGQQSFRIQEAHELAYHILCDLVESALAEDQPGQK